MGFWGFIEQFKGMVKYDNSILFSGSAGLILILFSGILTVISSVAIFQQILYGSIFLLGVLLIVYTLYRYSKVEDYVDEKNNPMRKRKFRTLEYDLTTKQEKVSK